MEELLAFSKTVILFIFLYNSKRRVFLSSTSESCLFFFILLQHFYGNLSPDTAATSELSPVINQPHRMQRNKKSDTCQLTPTNSDCCTTYFFFAVFGGDLTEGVSHNNSLSLIIFALKLHKRKTRGNPNSPTSWTWKIEQCRLNWKQFYAAKFQYFPSFAVRLNGPKTTAKTAFPTQNCNSRVGKRAKMWLIKHRASTTNNNLLVALTPTNSLTFRGAGGQSASQSMRVVKISFTGNF